MAKWQPLSVRRGIVDAEDEPYEGIPEHLVAGVLDWIGDRFYRPHLGMQDEAVLRTIASRLRVAISPGSNGRQVLDTVLAVARNDEDLCLDVVDMMLRFETYPPRISELETMLAIAGSAWRVADNQQSLERRVDETAQTSYAVAVSQQDAASDELRQAWHAAYGRDPDASDAWDHAIKAVEEILKPIIVPSQASATLGHILGQLRSQRQQFHMILQDNGLANQMDAIDTLDKMLRFIWPNPDRHGGGAKRVPTLDEAQAVVQLVVTIVQWARGGVLRKLERSS